MNHDPGAGVIYLGGLLVLGLIGVIILSVVMVDQDPTPTPQETFEAHSLALDEERYEDAKLLSNCQLPEPSILRQVARDLEDYGGFTGTYPVVGVWSHSSGDRAILDLQPPVSGLPTIQPMMKVDGKWLLSCE